MPMPALGNFSDDLVPAIAPAPVVKRVLKPLSWYRPRKQYIRKYQWNHEIVQHIINKRSPEDGSILRVFGLPSSEYLDLLSMRAVCEKHQQKVQYLGFNSSYLPPDSDTESKPKKHFKEAVDIYSDLQAKRMIESSSFVHTSSWLYPGRFELLRHDDAACWVVVDRFANFDVINLDICGCIVDPNNNKATSVLEAISEILRWQSVRRFTPWLFYVTTYCKPEDVNREACQTLIDAIKSNADNHEEFRTAFRKKVNIEVDDLHASFRDEDTMLPNQSTFMGLFALAIGKWLSCRLQMPSPCSYISMLPSFCFRHVDDDDPKPYDPHTNPCLLSLAYLVEPSPEAGDIGIAAKKPTAVRTPSARYLKHAKQILNKAFDTKDL
ncbi:MAG: hypothetical protein QM703_11750 [Gemmatales bacterium]